MSANNLNERFELIYGYKPNLNYFAPGRINLIGEHIDYSGGHVFPCAITQGTYATVSVRDDNTIRLASDNFKDLGIYEFTLDSLDFKAEDDWTNYVKGFIKILKDDGYLVDKGFDVLYYGNIPNGAGLSSSASLEMLTGVFVKDINNLDITDIDLVKIGMRTENEYIKVQSGIMDQFAITMGQKDKAIYLNTNNLEYELVPLKLNDYVIVIMNTNKRRGLNDSKYNERRSQCESALEILNTVHAEKYLCDHPLSRLEEHLDLFQDELVYKRARHAITENLRVLKAKEVLQNNDLESFGKLMNASHDSLRDDYDVTGIELDTIVSLAIAQDGVLGARVTGAGFGGCAIALVKGDIVDSFTKKVGELYAKEIGYEADFYIATPAQGAHKI
ncbi:MAG: galactokinase [Erysipelothrix sp.]|nr:galactokinase [Erysipelothrix sp.]